MERPHPDANIFTTKEIFDRITGETDINTDINWEEIDHQIAPYGYHLLITDGENTVYSSLEEEQTELISRMLSEEWTAEPQAMNIEGNRVIGMVTQDGETVIAINNFSQKGTVISFPIHSHRISAHRNHGNLGHFPLQPIIFPPYGATNDRAVACPG